MDEKKVIAFIVEGPSDEAALGSIMKEYFSSSEVQFVVVHGDIALRDYVSVTGIINKINEQVESIKRKYRYSQEDFLKLIHITDTDGVYIPESDIKEADVEQFQYYEDHIDVKNVSAAAARNRKTGKVHGIPYRIYFNSCNLEHVLYHELRNFTDEEKQILSDDFAERYEGRSDEFLKWISNPQIAVPGTYQQTWDYIEKERNSLNRHSNMHLIFE